MRHLIVALSTLALLGGCPRHEIGDQRPRQRGRQLGRPRRQIGARTPSNAVDTAGDKTQNRIAGLDNRMAGLVDPPAAEGWIGRWKGVEGLNLVIAADPRQAARPL